MKRTLLAVIVAAGLLLGTAGSALALPEGLPPNPVRDAAVMDQTCANGVGIFTHGAWVSGVALGFYDPYTPGDPCKEIGIGD